MAQLTDKWGKTEAAKRYGTQPTFGMPSNSQMKPQCPEDKQGPGYDNNAPSNWIRGRPSATSMPHFDKTKK